MEKDIRQEKEYVNSVIKSDNKRARKKLLVLVAIALILGLGVGFLVTSIDDSSLYGIMSILSSGFALSLPYIFVILSIAILLAAILMFSSGKKLADSENCESKEMLYIIGKYLSQAQILTSILTVFAFFAMGAVVPYIWFYIGLQNSSFIIVTIMVIVDIIACTALSSKCVSLIRTLMPEKRGSVYDSKFSQKWLGSCNEKEKMTIYRSSFSSYRATNKTCIVLWCIFSVGNILYDFGIDVILAITVIWLVNILSYSLAARKIAKEEYENNISE